MSNKKAHTCCVFGHRTINETDELRRQLSETIEGLITDEKVDTFLFGSKSRFNSLCLELVTEMKEKYPHVKRVYVRAEFPIINNDYRTYLLNFYEDTYYPDTLIGAGKSVYIRRNCEMIEKSQYCIVYYDKHTAPTTRKSGTETALRYAAKHQKVLLLFPK